MSKNFEIVRLQAQVAGLKMLFEHFAAIQLTVLPMETRRKILAALETVIDQPMQDEAGDSDAAVLTVAELRSMLHRVRLNLNNLITPAAN